MTADSPTTSGERRIGIVATTALGLVLLGWALTVDFPKVTGGGFFSDGATYYSLTHSLAEDGDFAFTREDLQRVWREFATGPEGIFLKRGRDVQGIAVASSPPYVEIVSAPDPDQTRLYYGKSFVFPLFAAPFVWLFGTNGFLVFHAALMTACFGCAYAFLVERSAPLVAAVFAAAFLFASVAPVYMAWLTPDFFNLATVLVAYFFWTYKEAASHETLTGGALRRRLLTGMTSDILAAACLGVATFSKPTHVLLMLPILALLALRRQWLRGLIVGSVFAAVIIGFFAWNVAISGEWNYQGGEERATFYSRDPDDAGPRVGGFPFQSDRQTFETTGTTRETNRVLVEVVASGDAVGQVFRRNLAYFSFGRHTGFVPYFFPGTVAILLLLLAARKSAAWQWLALAGGLGSAIFLMLYMPFTYSGGGGPVGNRYFLGVYPVFLFVTPPMRYASALLSLAVGALFTAQLVFNPFAVSVHPGEHTKRGVYRLLPVELTLLNDLPVNLSERRSKVPLGGTPPVAAYFIDDNAYGRENVTLADGTVASDAFWVRGESRADIMLRAPAIDEGPPERHVSRSLRIARLEIQLETGALPNRVTLSGGTSTQVVEIPAHDRRTVTIEMPPGVPYKAYPELPTNYVYLLTIASETGFIPMFEGGGGDARFLGVFVRLVPQYE